MEYLVDALRRNFMVMKFVDGFSRTYLGDGKRNENLFDYKARRTIFLKMTKKQDTILRKVLNKSNEEFNRESN